MVDTSGGRHIPYGQRRSVAAFLAANRTLLAAAWFVGFISVGGGFGGGLGFLRLRSALPPPRPAPLLRSKAYNLTDFGAIGDGLSVIGEHRGVRARRGGHRGPRRGRRRATQCAVRPVAHCAVQPDQPYDTVSC
ncbi:hypothetical protein GUJ93_ZPchr0002g26725 [Zizania palustris]|uniref:Uncharacterized protein n=1 Tax=Zizania palustris TaxID=103762 RepID=A0A8J5SJG7_ZIZPA|nr:hypothetical protein GUJ93_ZPchr0002g26725 [Zizania palustris]